MRRFLILRCSLRHSSKFRTSGNGWYRCATQNPARLSGKPYPADLVLKARQFGISTCIQGDFFREVTTGSATTLTLAHDTETTQKLRRIAQRFYNNLPENFRPARKYSNNRIATYPDFDSEALIATAGNVQTGRGGTYSHFHGSEVAFWVDAEALVAGAMQGGEPYVVLESTPNGAQGSSINCAWKPSTAIANGDCTFTPGGSMDSTGLSSMRSEELVYTDDEQALVEKYNLSPEQIKWAAQETT